MKRGGNAAVGHGCVVRCREVGEQALVGNGSTLLDHAVVGPRTLVAAGSVVTPGTELPGGHVVAGIPAKPTKPIEGSAYRLAQTLPRYLPDALDQLRRARPLRQVLGDDFVDALIMVKEIEHTAYQRVISSWEREHLLLNV